MPVFRHYYTRSSTETDRNERFLQAGAHRVYITSRKAAACEAACEALNALPNLAPGARAISVPADSADPVEIERLVKQVAKSSSRVDILFANAGATWGESFDTHPDAAFAKVMDLNVKSVFTTIRLFTPLLQKDASLEDPSRVIITASVAGIVVGSLGENATFGYSASKAAVIVSLLLLSGSYVGRIETDLCW